MTKKGTDKKVLKKRKVKKDPLNDASQKLMIDKLSLDEELIKQPTLFFEIAEVSANATSVRDQAKEQLALKDAELGTKHRKKLEASGERATIQLIEERVQTDPIHQKYLEKYSAAKEHADKCYAMKESFQQRAYMLRELVALYVSGYYATAAMTNPNRRGTGESAYEANKKRLTETRKANQRRT